MACAAPPTSLAGAATVDGELDRLSRLLGIIYDAAIDSDRWEPCLEALRVAFDANFSSLIVRPGGNNDLGLIVSASGAGPLSTGNPLIATSPFVDLPPDRLVTLGDVLSESDWRDSAYYRDWCAPLDVFHVMACDISTKDSNIYGLRLTRPTAKPPFSPSDRRLAERLIPHLRRTLDLHEAIHRDRKLSSLYSQAMTQMMVGVILLDENGRIQEVNAMGSGILEMNDGLRMVGDQLEASYPTDNRKLHRLVRSVLAQQGSSKVSLIEAISVSRPSGKINFGVLVKAIAPDQWNEGKHRPSVAVFVRDGEAKADPTARLAQQMFQLTPTETSLVIQLANGLSLDEASEALNIRRNTARAHLRSIYSKTGVRRQPELVRIFLNSVVMLGSNDLVGS